MVLMEVLQQPISEWIQCVQLVNMFAQIVATILIALYVIFTYRTFQQIKKQTDFQQDAYLKIDYHFLKDANTSASSELVFDGQGRLIPQRRKKMIDKYIERELPEKMINALRPHFTLDEEIWHGDYLVATLTNYGKTPICEILLIFNIEIKNSEELVTKHLLKECETNVLHFLIQEIIGIDGDNIKVILISTAAFPIFRIRVTGTYSDIKGTKYKVGEEIIQGEKEYLQKLQTKKPIE